MGASFLLDAQNLHKRFGATHALRGASLRLAAGERHALIGENGAGKSTLLAILSGQHAADQGSMVYAGAPYAPRSPREARAQGLLVVHQELALCPGLSIEENLLLGREPRRWAGLGLDRRARRRAAQAALALIARTDLDPRRRIETLSPAEQQWVEIARALQQGARLLILDEPSSSLARSDVERLWALVRALSDQGCAVLLVSHALEELREVCTHWTVMRDGCTVGSGQVENTPTERWIELMAGRALAELYPRSPRQRAECLLRIQASPTSACLELHRGEILGVYGLIGAGRTECLRKLFGLDLAEGAPMELRGRAGPATPRQRWAQGLGLVSEDRAREGIALDLSVADNLCLPAMRGWWSPPQQRQRSAQHWIDKLGIKCSSSTAPARSLSGGNQQKLALARLFAAQAEVLLLDEPTRGVDVGAKSELYRWMDRLASGQDRPQAGAVLMVSSYVPELLGICDRIAVMRKGCMGPARAVSDWDAQSLVAAAFEEEH